jgi:RNA polymerase sigma-70 factor, ECF subfamily
MAYTLQRTDNVDRLELTAIVRVNQAGIYRYLRYLGADRPTAEDLVQETFLAAFKSRTAEQDLLSPSAWLRGIARNLFLQHCRRARRSPAVVGGEHLERAETTWRKVFLRDGDGFDYLEALRGCLQDLPPKQRGALDMRYRDKKSRGEMAQFLGISEDGIKSLLRRLRAALADCVEKRLALEGTDSP